MKLKHTIASRYEKWQVRVVQMTESKVKSEGTSTIITKFFLAPILLFLCFGVLFLILRLHAFSIVGSLMVAYFVPPLGKESIIPIAIGIGVHPLLIALSVAYIDVIVALFLLWNYDFAKLAPLLGFWMERFENKAVKITRGKLWIKGLQFVGLVLFVMIPFQGSGAVGGTIVGRMAGLNRYVIFIAILIGAIVGCLIIAYSADVLKNIFFS